VHDPDAEDTVRRQEGYDVPYGLVVECDSLHLTGLSEDPGHVVLAGNRGQSHGALGNYTLFFFKVRDLELDHLTLGNYCSVDLDYALKPGSCRRRRTDAVTQAQLAVQSGDRLSAHNCRFVGRLNLRPVSGAERCLYEKCHFECTDDALNGRAVYLDCDFDFYGNRPLYDTEGPGAVFLKCMFRVRGKADGGEESLYFTKEGGTVAVVDCVFQGKSKEIAWTKYPLPTLKCFQYGVFFQRGDSADREPFTIGGEGASETVSMEGKGILEGYRLETEGGVVYNTYNLLRGEDGWDPGGMKETAIRAGKDRVPVFLMIEASAEELVPDGEGSILQAKAFYFYGKQAEHTEVSFYTEDRDRAYVQLTDHGDGSCLAECRSMGEESSVEEKHFMGMESRKVLVHAATEEGLAAAAELTVLQKLSDAPGFLEMPVLVLQTGSVRIRYCLALEGREDQSLISWYRCEDAEGGGAVLSAVSRGDRTMAEYPLTWGDVGYYLMAQVEPRCRGSAWGAAVRTVLAYPVSEKDLYEEIPAVETAGRMPKGGRKRCIRYTTDFSCLPTVRQEKILPGFWTVDACRPEDMGETVEWRGGSEAEPWKYGKTGNGSAGFGLYQNVQGARLMYTPRACRYGDMYLRLDLDPAKTAGQGFGSAGQYMDICVKFDTASLTGYGVRILRTKEASDGVLFALVAYDHGMVHRLTKGVMTSCYRTGCRIVLSVRGNLLRVCGGRVGTARYTESEADMREDTFDSKYVPVVELSAEIEENPFGGIAIWHTGTPGTGGWQNTTMLHFLEAVFCL